MIMRQKLERRMTWPALAACLLTGLLVLPTAPDRAGAQAPAPEGKPPPTELPGMPPADPVRNAEEPKSPATSEEVKMPPTPANTVVVNPLPGIELRGETIEVKDEEGGPIEIRGVDGGAVEMVKGGNVIRASRIRIDRGKVSAESTLPPPAGGGAPSGFPGQPPPALPGGIRPGGPPRDPTGSGVYSRGMGGLPSPAPVQTGQERRLQNLEAKIDHVLKALETLQGKATTSGGGSRAGFRAAPVRAGGAPTDGRATGVSGQTSGGLRSGRVSSGKQVDVPERTRFPESLRSGRISSAEQRPSTIPAQELTPEQEALIESLDAEFQAKMEPLEAQMQALEQQYEETILKIIEKAPATGEPARPASRPPRPASRTGLSPATTAPDGNASGAPEQPAPAPVPPTPSDAGAGGIRPPPRK